MMTLKMSMVTNDSHQEVDLFISSSTQQSPVHSAAADSLLDNSINLKVG